MDKDMEAIWQDVLASVKEFLPEEINEIWLATSRPVSIDGDVLIIEASNQFSKSKMETVVMDHLVRFLHGRGYALSVSMQVARDVSSDSQKDRGSQKIQIPQKSANGLNPNYVFESFVVGKSNRLAHAASLAVSDSPGVAYNPLFIWGGVGLGKTHLMHAIAHHVGQNIMDARTLYVSSEKFTNDLITAIRNNSTHEFRGRYRNLDLLLIDDIQFITGKEQTQEEFFNTFNTLYEASKQIVISSDRPPRDILGVEERLVSRFESGLVTDIQTPDLETRVAILQKKADFKNRVIPEEVILFLAQNIPSNIRELEGALNRVIAYSEINSEPMNTENIGVWLKDILRGNAKGQVSIDYIQQIVAESFGITVEELLSPNRTAELALARQIAMYTARKNLRMTVNQIAIAFNKKDHTTVLYACRRIEEMIKTNLRVKTIVDNLQDKM
ncbi:MAG: chromosomal replication initiator protein DnaA [Synergistaceae bacterium]|nr:chromosomal replication initiator protein DnaA [Synergistaceae bacterium]